MTPQQLARRARADLKKAADPKVAASQRRFFKPWEKITLHGVATGPVRQIERNLYQQVRKDWTYFEASTFCDILMRDRYIEAKALGLMLLARYRRYFEAGLAKDAHRWLEAGLSANWAVTDQLATQVLSALLATFPSLDAEFAKWTKSSNVWVRRAGIVVFVKPSGKGAHLDLAYDLVASLCADEEDLMHKACGWLLREAGKIDRRRLTRFLLESGATLPRTTVRYAIEHFSTAERRRIMEKTRPGGRVRAKASALLLAQTE